jgi:hypothetical protein
VDDIERYEQTYRGSAEEAHDLKELYTRFSGDMKQCVLALREHGFCASSGAPLLRPLLAARVFSWLCCSRVDVDSHRFMEALQQSIAKGEPQRARTPCACCRC